MSESPAPQFGRAGRNLPVATAVGVSLVALLGLSLFISPELFALLAAAVMMLAVRELVHALTVELPVSTRYVVYAAAPAIVLSAFYGGAESLLTAFVSSVLLILAVRLPQGHDKYVSNTSRAIFILAYAPLMAGFAAMLAASDNGAQKVLAFVALTAATDIGGYFSGVAFGAHPMAPKISPKKTWEGFAGALLLQVIVGVALWSYVFHDSWWNGALVGFVMAITATLGDLVESMIKRDLGIKDMSALLPGHGGIMDRLDSLVVNAFIAWMLFQLFLK